MLQALALLLLGSQEIALGAGPAWTRETVRKRLQTLREQVLPPGYLHDAMCYDPAPLPGRVEHVCPVCGHRTVYALPKDGVPIGGLQWLLNNAIRVTRQRAAAIKGLKVSLDESRYCSRCAPQGEAPVLGLVVRLEDGREIRTWGMNEDDLGLLEHFVASPKAEPPGEGERLTQVELDRLAMLLGEP